MMDTPEKRLHALREMVSANPRLHSLLIEVGNDVTTAGYSRLHGLVDSPNILNHELGCVKGVAKFVSTVTTPPTKSK